VAETPFPAVHGVIGDLRPAYTWWRAMHNPPQLLLPLNKLARLFFTRAATFIMTRWMSAFYAWSGPTNRTGLFDSVFEHCLCSFLLIARRPHETLQRDIVLFGLYLRLGQLLVLDGTVMLAFDASRPGSVVLKC
jgi:hypothetical protein